MTMLPSQLLALPLPTLRANVRSHCLRLLGHAGDLDHLTDDVTSTAALRLLKLKDPAKAIALLAKTIPGEIMKYRSRKPRGFACSLSEDKLRSSCDTASPNPLDDLCENEELSALRENLGLLSQLELDAICTEYPLNGACPSVANVAAKHGLSESRIRQIKPQVIAKLKRAFTKQGLED